jgi:hypothetical protein
MYCLGIPCLEALLCIGVVEKLFDILSRCMKNMLRRG